MSKAPVTDSFGALVKRHRQYAKLSQTQLAARVGVTQATVSLWENDVDRPSRDNQARLAKALGLHEIQLIEAMRSAPTTEGAA